MRDGAEALELGDKLPTDLIELGVLRAELSAGICALQSLDDLGSAEANQAAWDDMTTLQKRYQRVMKRIKKLEKKA